VPIKLTKPLPPSVAAAAASRRNFTTSATEHTEHDLTGYRWHNTLREPAHMMAPNKWDQTTSNLVFPSRLQSNRAKSVASSSTTCLIYMGNFKVAGKYDATFLTDEHGWFIKTDFKHNFNLLITNLEIINNKNCHFSMNCSPLPNM
jgi:hypothetical protein